jgi:hypothetical protein
LIKLAEQADHGLEIGHAGKAEQTWQHVVVTRHFAMLETVCATPHAKHELHNELLGSIATVASRLGQCTGCQGRVKANVIEHAFEERQTTPGGDFFVGKLQIEGHDSPPKTVHPPNVVSTPCSPTKSITCRIGFH